MIAPLSMLDLAKRCNAVWSAADMAIGRVETDSRKVTQGDVFVALRGEHHDAHDFIPDVHKAGAAAAIVARHVDSELPQLVVGDTVLALGQLGAMNRDQFKYPVIGVTGSCGKTTVKEMIASILSVTGNPLSTQGNLNNHIGVPQTLLALAPEHDAAVIEMGASALGEICYLANIVRPDIAMVNNVSAAHLQGFGSIDCVAQGKGEIYAGLGENSVAVINRDSPYADQWLQNIDGRCRVVTFGMEKHADFTAHELVNQGGSYSFSMHTPAGNFTVVLQLLGKHNVLNALAAAACCMAAGKNTNDIKQGLGAVVAYPGRLKKMHGINGAVVIDDSYNANPGSVKSAIDCLQECPGKRWLVLGDMAELGENSESMHEQVGMYARAANIDGLAVTGTLSRCTAGGYGEDAGRCFPTQEALVEFCRSIADSNTVFLVKGSRSSGMEKVVSGLLGATN